MQAKEIVRRAMLQAGCDVWLHSCGKVNEIIEGYIEADVEALMTHWADSRGGFILKDYYRSLYPSIGVDAGVATPTMYEASSRWSERLYGEPLPPRATARIETNQVGIHHTGSVHRGTREIRTR